MPSSACEVVKFIKISKAYDVLEVFDEDWKLAWRLIVLE
jgi:hypothetical protein